jgi:cation transport regulator ChaB
MDGGEKAMPKMTRNGTPRQDELPSTLKKSLPKAQRTFAETHDAAAEEYGDGERAHRVAFASLEAFVREGRRPLKGPRTCRTRRRERPRAEVDGPRGASTCSVTPGRNCSSERGRWASSAAIG